MVQVTYDHEPIQARRLGDPEIMTHHEKKRIREAAFYATKLYPGPVGELIFRELLTWEDFGYRLGGKQPVMQLVDHVMKSPLPIEKKEPA